MCLALFTAGDFISKLDVAFRRDEKIMRFLTIALDKHAVIYNERKRNGEFSSSKKEKDKEAIAQ